MKTFAIDTRKTAAFLILAAAVLFMTQIQWRETGKQKVYYGEVGAVKVVNNVKTVNAARTVNIAKTAMPVEPMPLVPPQLINQVLPVYPQEAREKNMEGVVVLKALIGAEGNVRQTEIKLSSGSQLLDDSATQAVANWKFSPAAQGGAALASAFEVPITFKLQ